MLGDAHPSLLHQCAARRVADLDSGNGRAIAARANCGYRRRPRHPARDRVHTTAEKPSMKRSGPLRVGLVLAAALAPARADEGMWTFNNFPADQMKRELHSLAPKCTAHGFKALVRDTDRIVGWATVRSAAAAAMMLGRAGPRSPGAATANDRTHPGPQRSYSRDAGRCALWHVGRSTEMAGGSMKS